MDKKTALRNIQRIVGKGARIVFRENHNAPIAEEREQARLLIAAAQSNKEAANFALNARRDALLAGDAEYQRLLAEALEARKVRDELGQKAHAYRVEVYRDTGSLSIRSIAHADNWSDAVAQIAKNPSGL